MNKIKKKINTLLNDQSKHDSGSGMPSKVSDISFHENKHGREKRIVANVLEKKLRDGIDFKEIVDILRKFSLIKDSGKHNIYTPETVYEVLKDHLDEYITPPGAFEDRFKRVAALFLDQYLHSKQYEDVETGKNKFEGYEWMGGGMSRSGDSYTVSEKHFVRQVLRPALNEYYSENPERAYDFVKKYCIHRDKSDEIQLTADHPDFLLRSSIDVLLREYHKGDDEAEGILKEFMHMKNGLPDKTSLIFEAAYNQKAVQLTDEEKWGLVEVQMSIEGYEGIPANVFVEKIISQLARNEHQQASDKLNELVGNEEFLKQGFYGGERMPERIGDVADERPKYALELCKKFMDTEFFASDLDMFESNKLGYVFSVLIENDKTKDQAIEFMKEMVKSDDFIEKKQVIVTKALLGKESDESPNEEFLVEMYKEFVWPALEYLGRDLKQNYKESEYGKIYNTFNLSTARENIVKLASKLAKKGEVKKALSIVDIFIDDPNPFEPKAVNPEDKEGKYDKHKKVKEGEQEVSTITTVRVWCGWTLLQSIRPEAREYTQKIYKHIKALVNDHNYFVQIYGIRALAGLAGNSLRVMPDNHDELFLNSDKKSALQMAKEIQETTFDVLDQVVDYDETTQSSFARPLAHLLSKLSALNKQEADQLIDTIADKASDEVIAHCAPVFIYFAEMRELDYQDWKWQTDNLFYDLDEYDPAHAREVLEDVMKRSDVTRRKFASRFANMPENVPEPELGKNPVEVALKYLRILVDEYNDQTFRHVYRFIKENLDSRHAEGCKDLLLQALKKEQDYFNSIDIDNLGSREGHSYIQMGHVMQNLFDELGADSVIEALRIICEFPEEVYIRLSGVQQLLKKEIHSDESKELANKLEEKQGVHIK